MLLLLLHRLTEMQQSQSSTTRGAYFNVKPLQLSRLAVQRKECPGMQYEAFSLQTLTHPREALLGKSSVFISSPFVVAKRFLSAGNCFAWLNFLLLHCFCSLILDENWWPNLPRALHRRQPCKLWAATNYNKQEWPDDESPALKLHKPCSNYAH